MSDTRCVCCGDVIPEGRQVCTRCEREAQKFIQVGTPENGRADTAKKVSARLVIALAGIAAVTAIGFIAGYAMQPWIVSYWLMLTMKNVVDYIGVK